MFLPLLFVSLLFFPASYGAKEESKTDFALVSSVNISFFLFLSSYPFIFIRLVLGVRDYFSLLRESGVLNDNFRKISVRKTI